MSGYRPLPRTPQSLEAIEEALCTFKGDMVAACRSLKFNPRQLHQWAIADPTIAEAVHAAQLVGWAQLEHVAYKRAVKGVKEDVYYQGEVVGQKVVYSDGLLAQMLKARVPGYSTDEAANRSLTVNVAIMPRASTYEEWLEHKDIALNAPAEKIEDAVFEPVPAPTVLRDVL